MADPTTSNRSYAVPTRGSDVGTWDTPLNANFGLLDNNLGGVSTIALTNAPVTLTSTQAACGTIRLTGALTSNVTITFPAVSGWWTIDNQTTGAFAAILTCGTGNNIATEQGVATDILTDGANVKFRDLGRLGGYWDYAGSTVPLWVQACTIPPFLNCNGGTFSAATYPYLNTILGGNTLPDFRGVVPAFLNQGTGRLVNVVNGNVNYSTGGTDTVTLSAGQIPTITSAVSVSVSGSISGVAVANEISVNVGTSTLATSPSAGTSQDLNLSGSFSGSGSGSATSNNTGSSFHSNTQPTTIGGIRMIRAA